MCVSPSRFSEAFSIELLGMTEDGFNNDGMCTEQI